MQFEWFGNSRLDGLRGLFWSDHYRDLIYAKRSLNPMNIQTGFLKRREYSITNGCDARGYALIKTPSEYPYTSNGSAEVRLPIWCSKDT